MKSVDDSFALKKLHRMTAGKLVKTRKHTKNSTSAINEQHMGTQERVQFPGIGSQEYIYTSLFARRQYSFTSLENHSLSIYIICECERDLRQLYYLKRLLGESGIAVCF